MNRQSTKGSKYFSNVINRTQAIKYFFIALLALTLALVTLNTHAQVCFTGPNTIALGTNNPYVLTTADFNGDGFPDLAIPNNGSNTISILLGDGKGGFTIGTSIPTNMPWSVTNADFNGDGKIDLAVTNMVDNTVSIFLGDGLGGFTPGPTPTYPAGTGFLVRVVITADFNGDGKPDLAVTNQGSQDVTILIGNGNGTFTAAPGSPFSSGGIQTMGINAGDFNGDGKLDLAVGNLGSGYISIFLGNGNGTFTAAPTPTVTVGTSPYGILISDFNKDGNLDFAVGNNGSSSVSVLFGNGAGGFGSRADYTVASGPQFGVLADFNGDGILDIAEACQYSNTTSILLGNAAGGFSATPINFIVGNNSAALTSADFNGDGKPDLAVTNFSGSSVSILLSPITTAGGDTTICAGASTQLNAKGGNGYKWTSSSATIACDTCHNPIVSPVVTSTFVVTISNGTCSSTDSATVTVQPGLVLQTFPSDTTICSGSSATLSSSGATSYAWSLATGLSCITCAAPSVNPTISTTYVVTGVNGVCSATDTAVVQVGNLAIAGLVSALRDTICQGSIGNLYLFGNSSVAIQWQSSLTPGNFSNINLATDSSYQTNPLLQSTYYRVVVGFGSCVDTSNFFQIYVPPALIANFSFTASGKEVTFNADSSVGNIVLFSWTFGDGTASTAQNPVHTYPKTDTTYNVCLSVYDGSNCSYTYCKDVMLTPEGIVAISAQTNWNIYPNPFSDQLSISANKNNNRVENIALYNVLGQMIINDNAGNSTDNLFHLNVSGLASGMYYLEIRTATDNYVQPVVKQ